MLCPLRSRLLDSPDRLPTFHSHMSASAEQRQHAAVNSTTIQTCNISPQLSAVREDHLSRRRPKTTAICKSVTSTLHTSLTTLISVHPRHLRLFSAQYVLPIRIRPRASISSIWPRRKILRTRCRASANRFLCSTATVASHSSRWRSAVSFAFWGIRWRSSTRQIPRQTLEQRILVNHKSREMQVVLVPVEGVTRR